MNRAESRVQGEEEKPREDEGEGWSDPRDVARLGPPAELPEGSSPAATWGQYVRPQSSVRRSPVVGSPRVCSDMFWWPREHSSRCVPSCRLGRCKARKGNDGFRSQIRNNHSETPNNDNPDCWDGFNSTFGDCEAKATLSCERGTTRAQGPQGTLILVRLLEQKTPAML